MKLYTIQIRKVIVAFCIYSDVIMKRLGAVYIDGELDTVEHLTFGHNTFIRLGDQVRCSQMRGIVAAVHLK